MLSRTRYLFVTLASLFATIALAQPGQVWNTIRRSGQAEHPYQCILDGSGNLITVGSAYIGENDAPVVDLCKLDPNGHTLWVKTYVGTTPSMGLNRSARADSVALDGSGNIFVGCTVLDAYNQFTRWYVLKYSSTGTPLLAHNAIALGYDCHAAFIKTDGSGNVYLAGSCFVSPSDTDNSAIIAKFDSNLNLLWSHQSNPYGDGAGPEAFYNDMFVDSSGNAYVTGMATGGGRQVFTEKYGPDGTRLWSNILASAPLGAANGNAIAVDASGNAYVATSDPLGSTTEAEPTFVIKYDAATGADLWRAQYQQSASTQDMSVALVLDSVGEPYALVNSTQTTGGPRTDIVVASFSQSGSPIWQYMLPNSAGAVLKGYGITLDRYDYAYVNFKNPTISGGMNMVAAVPGTGTGAPLWMTPLPASSYGTPHGLIITPNADMFVLGGLNNASGGYEQATRYRLAPLAQDDFYQVAHNTPLMIAAPGVLANDHWISGFTPQVVTGPSHGSLAFSSDGSFKYTPNTGYSGTDSFTYVDKQGTVSSNTATVRFIVG